MIAKVVNILMLADYKATTGFATVSQNIVRVLKKRFGARLCIDICAINYFGEPAVEYDGTVRVFPVAKMRHEVGGDDEFGRHVFLSNLAQHEYDGAFVILDIGMVSWAYDAIRAFKKKKKEMGKKVFKSIYYFPIDGPCYPKWFEGIDVFDEIITYTNYGKKEITKIDPALEKVVKVIPHGINVNDFHPIAEWDRKLFREQYFKEHASKIIINGGNRNQARKNIPTLLMGFKAWKERCATFIKVTPSILYLHCNPLDWQGWDLRVVLQQLGLKEGEDVLFPPQHYQDAGADIATLNNIICSSDIYITACGSEGWGFWPHQAAACKIPVIAPYSTSLIEMSGKGSWFWSIRKTRMVFTMESLIRYDVEPADIAREIESILITSPSIVEGRVKDAYRHATSLSWENVGQQWIELFENLLF